MRTSLILLFILSLTKGFSQTSSSSINFSIAGKIIGRDTGSVMLWYVNNENRVVRDTLILINGEFHIAGIINRACEALLWTDLSKRSFDDPSVVHFLLEPGETRMSFNINNPFHPVIDGSKSEEEKERWDSVKSDLLTRKRELYNQLFKLAKSKDSSGQLTRVYAFIDSVNRDIRALDVTFISKHPNSYFSSYLLWQHRRILSLDTVKMFYESLGNEVKMSSLGRSVLVDLYPLTNDAEFRRKNPLVSVEFDKRLQQVHSVYELDFTDTSGKTVKLNSFKGKYLVIDFWASWCKPCIDNIPSLNQLINGYQSDPVQFISISMDENINTWKWSVIKNRCAGVQWVDTNAFSSLAAIYCKVLFVPTYIIVDPNGRIINYRAPQASEIELKQLIDKLLNKAPQIGDRTR